jgi:hypothetical protein
MKLVTLAFLFCTPPLALRSQPNNPYNMPLDSASGKISFDSVFNVPGLSKDDIYSRSKEWIANYYKSAKDVINMDDKGSGIIKIKALNTSSNDMDLEYTSYDMYIYIKDFKYKCVVNNLEFKTQGPYSKVPAEYTLTGSQGKPLSEMLRTLAGDIFSSLNISIKNKSKSDF